MIRLLTDEEKQSLSEIFDEEFDNSLVPMNANVIGVIENGEIKGFLVAETLIRVGMIYTGEELRNTTESAIMAKQMALYAYKNIPEGASAIVISSDEKFEPLLKRLGMREVEGKVFRRDF